MNEKFVLFIAPSVNNELFYLQQCFNLNRLDQLSWVAHTTMLIDEPEQVQKAIPILAKSFNSFIARIERISLYEFFPARFIAEEKLL